MLTLHRLIILWTHLSGIEARVPKYANLTPRFLKTMLLCLAILVLWIALGTFVTGDHSLRMFVGGPTGLVPQLNLPFVRQKES